MRTWRLEHRQVGQPGDPVDDAVSPRAQSKIGTGIVPGQIVSDDLRRHLGSQVPVEDAGPARFDYLHERLGIAEADAADLDDVGL